MQPGSLPLLDWTTGGWIGGMQDAHRTLLRLANDATKIVPAAGPVMTKAHLQANLDMVTKIRDQMVKLMKQGLFTKEMIAAKAMKDFAASWTATRITLSIRPIGALGACSGARRDRLEACSDDIQ